VKILTIPHDTSPPPFKVSNNEEFEIVFTQGGKVHHNDSGHFRPLLPKNTVVAHRQIHTAHEVEPHDVEIHFTFDTGKKDGVTSHTIFIGN
jgi:hypothetical protein